MSTTLQFMARKQDLKMQNDLARVMRDNEAIRGTLIGQQALLTHLTVSERILDLECENRVLADQLEGIYTRTKPRRSNRLRGFGLGQKGTK